MGANRRAPRALVDRDSRRSYGPAEPRERRASPVSPVQTAPRGDSTPSDGMSERAQRLLEIVARRGQQRRFGARRFKRNRADGAALRARQRLHASQPTRVEQLLVLLLNLESTGGGRFVMREPRTRNVTDRAALRARAHAEIDVL